MSLNLLKGGKVALLNSRVFLGIFTLAFVISSLSYSTRSLDATVISIFCLEAGVWFCGLALAGQRGQELRITNPLFLLSMWYFLYFLFPASSWFQLSSTKTMVTEDLWIRIQWLNTLFMLCTHFGYHVAAKSFRVNAIKVLTVPSGILILAAGLMPLVITTVARLYSGGPFLYDSDYGTQWFDVQDQIADLRREGGLGYILLQLQSKIGMLPYIIQGIGAGLIAVNYMRRGGNFIAVFAVIGLLVVVNMLLAGGTRSANITVGVIAICLIDLVARPIPVIVFVSMLAVGLVVFEFLGEIRVHAPKDYLSKIPEVYEDFRSSRRARGGEFQLMIEKEALCLELFGRKDIDPVVFLYHLMTPLPSQINPMKKWYVGTDIILARIMLGEKATARGNGVAGTTVGDSFRGGGVVGVGVISVLLGITLRVTQSLLISSRKSSSAESFYRLCIWIGFLGSLVFFVRGDMGMVVGMSFYGVLIPILVWKHGLGAFVENQLEKSTAKNISAKLT